MVPLGGRVPLLIYGKVHFFAQYKVRMALVDVWPVPLMVSTSDSGKLSDIVNALSSQLAKLGHSEKDEHHRIVLSDRSSRIRGISDEQDWMTGTKGLNGYCKFMSVCY